MLIRKTLKIRGHVQKPPFLLQSPGVRLRQASLVLGVSLSLIRRRPRSLARSNPDDFVTKKGFWTCPSSLRYDGQYRMVPVA